MKKKTMLQKTMMLIMTTAMVIMLFAGCFILSNAKESCGPYHQPVWRYTDTSLERRRTHSHYKEKNGRLDYWPCIVYEKFDHYKLYCLDCGYIKETKKESRGEVHNDAY